jgi:hypothetical protein
MDETSRLLTTHLLLANSTVSNNSSTAVSNNRSTAVSSTTANSRWVVNSTLVLVLVLVQARFLVLLLPLRVTTLRFLQL